MKTLKIFILITILTVKSALAESSCATGYGTIKHTIHFDINVSPYTVSVITPSDKSLADSTFILSEDGYCPNGYIPYSRLDAYIYPLVTKSAVCPSGEYPAGGTCTPYAAGECTNNRYNCATVSSTFALSEDGYCATGFVPYSRRDDWVYPFVSGNNLCSGLTYPGGGNCNSYAQSTCPEDYHSFSLNDATIVGQTNNACPSNYRAFTTMTNCDVAPGDTCADIATVINLLWYDGVNDNPTSSTCTYNTQIDLPETPTRAGYIFNGWKVRD